MLDFLILALTAVLSLVFAVIYFYPGPKKKVTTVPGLEPSSPINGNLGDMAKVGTLPDFLTQLHKDYGDIASFWWGTQLVVSVASPELFKQTSGMFDRPKLLFQAFEPVFTPHSITYRNGQNGRAFHSKTGSAYSYDMMHHYVPLLNKIAYELARRLENVSEDENIPLEQYMFSVAIKMISQTSFGNWFEDENEILKLHVAYEKCMSEMERRISEGTPDPESEQEKQFQTNKRDLEFPILKALELRKKKLSKEEERVLLDILMEICESEEEIIGNAVTYLFAGFHTTGCLLTWSIYFLATHQQVQEELYKEILDVLGEEEVTNEIIKDLVYLRQVLNETLRVSQLGPWAARVQDFDSKLGGHRIPAGTKKIYGQSQQSLTPNDLQMQI